MPDIDEYIKKVIELGDEGSKLLNAICAPTLKNSQNVEILKQGANEIAVLRIPKRYSVVVHSSGGDPREKDLASHASSLVERLVEQARAIGATPLGFANVIDSNSGEKSVLETIAHSLVNAANTHKVAIMNGENAILGVRITGEANVSGTMISIRPQYRVKGFKKPIHFGKTAYAKFDPEGKAVFINSDGVGTKTEFYERSKKYGPALDDSLAMKIDDAIKLGATVKVVSDVVETKGAIPFSKIAQHASSIAKEFGIIYILQHERVGNRLRGYVEYAPVYNISGSVVSVIDEERLENPLKPNAGDYIIAIRGNPNPRSNGITDKRKTMIRLFGEDWHKTAEGKLFLGYLASPSTILYPVFKELVDNHSATSVYHMSGGAYNGKLARPLAKHNLFARLKNLFPPDWRELTLAGSSFASAETAYGKWPMGNDGFITTQCPTQAMEIINSHGLEANMAGVLEHALKGRTGVELEGIKASNGENVYFSGK